MSYQDEVKSNYEQMVSLELDWHDFQDKVARREPDERRRFEPREAHSVVSHQHGGSVCWCQNAYNTGFTGDRRIDARLQYHYEHGLDRDVIRRDYDHYAKGIPFVEFSAKRRYCFKTKSVRSCFHRECEHARHRAPSLVKKMRFEIEKRCPAEVHYPELNERIDRAGDTRPEMDNQANAERQWDELQFRLHRFALDPARGREDVSEPKATSVDDLTDAVYGHLLPSLDAGLMPDDERERFERPIDVRWDEQSYHFDPEVLADYAAEQAATALFADREPGDVTLDRLKTWERQRAGLTIKPESEASWQDVAEAIGEFIAA